MAHPSFTSQHTPGGVALSLHDIENLISKNNLEPHRNKLMEFTQVSLTGMLTIVYMHQLAADTRTALVINMLTALTKRLEKLCEQAWKPTDAQQKLIRALIRHFLVKPLATYAIIPRIVKAYLYDHAEDFHLPLYKTNPVVCATVNSYITSQVSAMKSSFRKAVFNSVQQKHVLESFAKNVFHNYHLHPVPNDIPTAMLGTLALMREIALPLTNKKTSGTANDTGFWRGVEKGLDDAYEEFGKDSDRHKSSTWDVWNKCKIADNDKKWPNRGAISLSATDNMEIDMVVQGGGEHDENDVAVDPALAEVAFQATVNTQGVVAMQTNDVPRPVAAVAEPGGFDMHTMGAQIQACLADQ